MSAEQKSFEHIDNRTVLYHTERCFVIFSYHCTKIDPLMRIMSERRYDIIIIGTEKAEHIIHEYSDMIYRIAVHNLKNPTDAEDILQEVCLALLTKCPADRGDTFIKHWLIRVTINKCNSFRRQFWQTRRESIDDYLHLAAPEEQGVMDVHHQGDRRDPRHEPKHRQLISRTRPQAAAEYSDRRRHSQ